LPKDHYVDSLRGRGLNHPTFQLRGGHLNTKLSPRQRNVRRVSRDGMICRWDVAKEPTIGEKGLS